jgi:hypothetical protein
MRYVRAYFDSWYLPGVATLIVSLLAPWLLSRWVEPQPSATASGVFWVCFAAPAVLGLSAWIAAARQLWRRAIAKSLFNLAAGFWAPFFSVGAMIGVLAFTALFSEAKDPFARDIVIPPDLKLREPSSAADPDAPPDAPPDPGVLTQDPDGERLRASCTGSTDAGPAQPVSVQLAVLEQFQAEPARLLQYLTGSAAWHVAEERGQRYAYRRFLSADGRWESSIKGFYSRDGCQLRVVIGLNGPVFAEAFKRTGELTKATSAAGPIAVKTLRDPDNGLVSSYLVVSSSGPSVEIFEESEREDRSATRAALSWLAGELTAAAEGKRPSARIDVSDTLEVVHGMQPGIYLVNARVNPGEPGSAYLKLYEHTRNTPLSVERIEPRSRQTMGFSSDPHEGFLYNVEITIYEGDWGVHYPARFELWFKPDSGKPARKLLQDIFRVEGWQR